jgi:hypothetical protein
MKLAARGSLLSPLFSVELHSNQPEEMVKFYEQALSLKFTVSSYPYRCYKAQLSQLALIISSARDHDSDTSSEPGKCTFGVLTDQTELPAGEHYFLHPQRPLGRAWPKKYASRVKDPDGHYLAFASSMEDVVGRMPPITSFRELLRCFLEYVKFILDRRLKRLRHFTDYLFDRCEYLTSRVTMFSRDLGEYSHVVASREGLYAVNSHSYRRLMRGSFFGLTIRDAAIYCFQSCGGKLATKHTVLNKGRLLKLSLDRNQIKQVEIIATDLDDGCHQIDFVGDDLLVVDCYNGRILQFKLGESGYVAHYPLGKLARGIAMGVYHMNSIAAHPDGTLWLLLHNHMYKPSEVVVLNYEFELVRRFSVRAGAAHNIVFTRDSSEYLIADSCGARVISAHGTITTMDMMWPRGISLDKQTCVVGDSFFSPRPFRRYVSGRIHFFDRSSWKCSSSLLLPAAPTEIRRIDGKDYSISNYLLSQSSPERHCINRSDICAGNDGTGGIGDNTVQSGGLAEPGLCGEKRE